MTPAKTSVASRVTARDPMAGSRSTTGSLTSKALSTAERLDRIRERISQPDFLANKGLGNEVGVYIFQYDARDELLVREQVARLRQDESLPCRIVERNLWQVFLDVCERRRILDKIPGVEERRGSASLLARMQKTVTPENLVEAMDWEPHEPGEVLFVTGVGQAYPFVRAHSILENSQHVFEDIPVVMFYPGRYDGQSLSLFGRLKDSNYYRAFDLLV